MGYFNKLVEKGTVPRVHPLLLSLTATIGAAERDLGYPDITSISENDPRALGSVYYMPQNLFPPLDMHISGQNSASPLSIINSPALTPAVNCQECQSPERQDNETTAAHKKGKKHRRGSSGGTRGNTLISKSAELTELLRITSAAETQ